MSTQNQQSDPVVELNVEPEVSREELRKIARYQKIVIYCVLVYLLLVAAFFRAPEPLKPLLSLAGLAMNVLSAVFVWLLAFRLYSTAGAIFIGIMTLIPLVGLGALLVINSAATSELRNNGVKVGFLGAKISRI